MLADGNLALCDLSPDCNQGSESPAWESGTAGHAGAYAVMDTGTNTLIVQSTTEAILWSNTMPKPMVSDDARGIKGSSNAILSIDRSGNVRLIREIVVQQHFFEVMWQSHTDLSQRQVPTVCQGSNLFFVHIPNTGGGNAVEAAMAPSCSREDRYPRRFLVERMLPIKGVGKLGAHLLLEEQRLLSPTGLHGARTFAIVRDPYERFVVEANRQKRRSLQEQINVCMAAR